MYVDFVRFTPDKIELLEGFDLLVVFNPAEDEKNIESVGDIRCTRATVISAESVGELQKKLKKAKGFVGVLSQNLKVNREAVMRRKVHAILDFESRSLDYASIKLAAEKDVLIEVSLSKFLRVEGFKRMKLFDETRLLLKLLFKFRTPFILTNGAERPLELRPKYQLYKFFAMLAKDAGLNEVDFLNIAVENSKKVYRKLVDSKYIINGLEVEYNQER